MPILYVSHSSAEVARLATTVVALQAGRVAAIGPPAQVLGNTGAVGSDTASVLIAQVAAHDADGLTRLETAAGPIFVARMDAPPGTQVRLRVGARDVILSRNRPEDLSALNILTGTITAIVPEDGPNAQVSLSVGSDVLIARVTRRSAAAMGLALRQPCCAILKAVAVTPGDLGFERPYSSGWNPADPAMSDAGHSAHDATQRG